MKKPISTAEFLGGLTWQIIRNYLIFSFATGIFNPLHWTTKAHFNFQILISFYLILVLFVQVKSIYKLKNTVVKNQGIEIIIKHPDGVGDDDIIKAILTLIKHKVQQKGKTVKDWQDKMSEIFPYKQKDTAHE